MTEAELNALLEENRDLVYAVARARFPSRADDPDLLQCGMIGLWEAVQKWDGIRSFTPFARTCIYHNMLDHVRRTDRAVEFLVSEIPDIAAPPFDLSGAELRAGILRALPPGTDRAVLLALSAGEPKRALAERMGLTVRQLTRKAAAAWGKLQREGGPV
jgi:RNA polymerase sigma factor (sigma-70 family)